MILGVGSSGDAEIASTAVRGGRVCYFDRAKVDHTPDPAPPRDNKMLLPPAEAPVNGESPGELVEFVSGEMVGARAGLLALFSGVVDE